MIRAAALASLLLVAAPAKSVEERYQAPMQGENYRVEIRAPQLGKVNARLTATVTLTALDGAWFDPGARPAVEASGTSGVQWPLKNGKLQVRYLQRNPRRWEFEVPFRLRRAGTHELVLGVEVPLAKQKEPVRVAVPWSTTAEPG